MKLAAILLTITTVALVAVGLYVPDMATLLPAALSSGILAAVLQCITNYGPAARAAGGGKAGARVAVAAAPAAPQAPAGPGSPAGSEAEVISFLAALQDKGRLVDFLMDDVTAYDDAQIGAAARVVHEGCRAAIDEVFTIVPVTESAEGATISVPANHRPDEFRLSGKLSGSAPFDGKVVHRGWKTTSCKLPQVVVPAGDLPCIAPAEVEVQG